MRKGDLVWGLVLAVISAFLIIPAGNSLYLLSVAAYPYLTGFVKFSVLATMGELLTLRIISGSWRRPRGLAAKALVWGIFGLMISFMFRFYPAGVSALTGRDSGFVFAFLSSTVMNLTFGPVFMAAHRVTDTCIDGFFLERRCRLSSRLGEIDWAGFIRFVAGRTIPFFWIPVHTISFLLPVEYRVLSAAFLSIALGAILAYGRRRSSGA